MHVLFEDMENKKELWMRENSACLSHCGPGRIRATRALGTVLCFKDTVFSYLRNFRGLAPRLGLGIRLT